MPPGTSGDVDEVEDGVGDVAEVEGVAGVEVGVRDPPISRCQLAS